MLLSSLVATRLVPRCYIITREQYISVRTSTGNDIRGIVAVCSVDREINVRAERTGVVGQIGIKQTDPRKYPVT